MILIRITKSLDEEKIFKRLISEMIYIKKQKHSLNLQNNTLDPLYENLFTMT